ncbi:MAG: V-type ATP synthase subunit E [bacterium]
MSLEKILERIEQDAKSQAEDIKKKASSAAEKIIQEANEQAEALKKSALEDAKVRAEQHKQRIISAANLEFRKEILAEKQNAIDEAFKEAMRLLVNMNDDEYKKTIKNMILSNVQTGDEEIIFSERDKNRLGNGFLRDVNNQLTKNKKKGNLTLSKSTYDMPGGFVMKRGDIELNNSFSALMESLREDLESEVSKILFPTE